MWMIVVVHIFCAISLLNRMTFNESHSIKLLKQSTTGMHDETSDRISMRSSQYNNCPHSMTFAVDMSLHTVEMLTRGTDFCVRVILTTFEKTHQITWTFSCSIVEFHDEWWYIVRCCVLGSLIPQIINPIDGRTARNVRKMRNGNNLAKLNIQKKSRCRSSLASHLFSHIPRISSNNVLQKNVCISVQTSRHKTFANVCCSFLRYHSSAFIDRIGVSMFAFD